MFLSLLLAVAISAIINGVLQERRETRARGKGFDDGYTVGFYEGSRRG